MSHVFSIFQIGPVQDFITCAKKTQDFWSGSYLLSYLTCVAMHEVVTGCADGKSAMIYPDLTQQPLYDYVAHMAAGSKNPWDLRPSGDRLRPTVPNRFVAKLDNGNAKTLLDAAETKVTEAFRAIAGKVKDALWNKISHSSLVQDEWNRIWTRQTGKDAFEIYWVISPLGDTQYSTSYEEAEALFGARKVIRNFCQSEEPGYKCTLCGWREPLHAEPSGSVQRGDLRKFWDKVRQKTGHRFREGEHLCAVCTTKRLAPEWVFGRDRDLPPTSSMAVADFLRDVVKAYRSEPTALCRDGKELVQNFGTAARAVATASGQDAYIEPLPGIFKLADGTAGLGGLLDLDGDWLLEETYQALREAKPGRPAVDSATLVNALEARANLIVSAREYWKAQGEPAGGPNKYYAVFAMDGDDMGKKIVACNSEPEHRALSKAMAEFSRKTAPHVIEQDHLGKVIYFGGDEGVAFVSLNDLVPMMDACRKAFEGLQLGSASPTACIGAVIAHHQQALLSVLREVRAALQYAKDLEGKSAFCLSIMKRSGGMVRARAHWAYDSFSVIPVLTDLISHYQAERLSDRWWRQLAEEARGFQNVDTRTGSVTVDLGLVFPETERLVTRHVSRDPSNTIRGGELTALIQSLQHLALKLSPYWKEFMGLMEAATYIARGGGR